MRLAWRISITLMTGCGQPAPRAPEPAVASAPGAFACVITTCGWRVADVSRALANGRDDSLDPAAREAAMNDAMVAAQRPAAGEACGSAAVTDHALARESAGAQEVLPALLAVLQTYRARTLVASEAAAAQCARDFATRELARTTALVGAQRLFQPPPSRVAGRLVDVDVYAYFAHELERARVAVTLAQPFLAVLDNTQVVGPPGVDDASFWRGSLAELQRFTQNGDREGPAGALQAVFDQLATLDTTTCKAALASVPDAPVGNDLFSTQRHALLADLRARCIR